MNNTAPPPATPTASGPYVVTCFERGPAAECADGCDLPLDHDGACFGDGKPLNVVSLQAFETLGWDYRRYCIDLLPPACLTGSAAKNRKATRMILEMPAQGGRVELPDGTGIVVESTTYEALSDAIGWGDAYRADRFTDAHALAYFNHDAAHPVCACGRRSLDHNHLACTDCIERACSECPVLDTVAVRFVKGYPAEKHSQEGRA